MGKKRTYLVDGSPVDVDLLDEQSFLQKFPNAEVAESYIVGKDTVDVPASDPLIVEAFRSKYPNAKPLFDEPLEKDTIPPSGPIIPPSPPVRENPLGKPSEPEPPTKVTIPQSTKDAFITGALKLPDIVKNNPAATQRYINKFSELKGIDAKALKQVYGNALNTYEDLKKVKAQYDQNPDDTDALYRLAQLHTSLGQYNLAYQAYDALEGKLHALGTKEYLDPNNPNKRPDYVQQRQLPAVSGMAYVEQLRGNEQNAQRLKKITEQFGYKGQELPSVGDGDTLQPGNEMTYSGDNPNEMVGVGSDTERSRYLKDIATSIEKQTQFVPAMEMVSHGVDKLKDTNLKDGISGAYINLITGAAETMMGIAGATTPEGAAFLMPFTQAQNSVKPEVAEWMMPISKMVDNYYKEKGIPKPQIWENTAVLGDFLAMAIFGGIAHGTIKGVEGKVKTRAELKRFVKSIEDMPASELEPLMAKVEEKVASFPTVEEYAADTKNKILKEGEQLNSLAREADVQVQASTPLEPYKPEPRPNSLRTVKEGSSVLMDGVEGTLDRGDDGTWYFNSDDGKSTQIKVEDKFNPTESLNELGIQVLQDPSPEHIARAMADAEMVGEVEYGGKQYFVSLDRVGNPEPNGDFVLRRMADGSLKESFDSHPNKQFGQERKLAIINKMLEERGLPKRKSLTEVKAEKPTSSAKKASEVKVEKIKEGKKTTKIFHGADIDFTIDGKKNRIMFATKNNNYAEYYAKQRNGKVFEFNIEDSKIAKEKYVKEKIESLGLLNNYGDLADVSDNLHRLIDPRFDDTSISKEGLDKLFSELEKEGYYGIDFMDENQDLGGKNEIESVAIFNPKELSKPVKTETVEEVTTPTEDANPKQSSMGPDGSEAPRTTPQVAEGTSGEVQQPAKAREEVKPSKSEKQVRKEAVLDLIDKYNQVPKKSRDVSVYNEISKKAKAEGYDVSYDKKGKLILNDAEGKRMKRSSPKRSQELLDEAKAHKAKVRTALRGQAASLRSWVLQHILKQGSVSSKDFKRYTGFEPKEVAPFAVTEKGSTFHQLWESARGEFESGNLPFKVTEDSHDFANDVAEILSEYPDRASMWSDLLSEAEAMERGMSQSDYEYFQRLNEQAQEMGLEDISEESMAHANEIVENLTDEEVSIWLKDLEENAPKTTEEINKFYEEHGTEVDAIAEKPEPAEGKVSSPAGEEPATKKIATEEPPSPLTTQDAEVGRDVSFLHAGQPKVGKIVEVDGGKYVIRADNGREYVIPKDKTSPLSVEEALQSRKNLANIAIAGTSLPFSIPKDLFQNIRKAFKKYTSIRGGMPKDIFQHKVEMEGGKTAALTEIKYTVKELSNAIKKSYGKPFKDIPATEVNKMNDYLKGNTSVGIPTDVAIVLDKMRTQIDAVSRRLIDEGLAEGDLALTIDKNMGTYVTRSYRKFDDPKWAEKVPETIRNQAKAYLRQEFPTATPAEIDGLIEYLLYEEGAPMQLLSSARIGSMDMNIFKRKKDIPFELRQLFGEYNDPVVNYARSMYKMSAMIEHSYFLNKVYADGINKYFYEKPTGQFHVKIGSDKNKAYSPLGGLYTTPELAEVFSNVKTSMKNDTLWSKIQHYYMALNAAVKVGKTVGSVQTHVRNLLSNLWFVTANGHFMNPKGGKLAWDVVKSEWSESANPNTLKYIQDLQRRGVIDDGVNMGELNDMIKDATKRYDEVDDLFRDGFVKKITRGATKAYQLEDSIYKVFAYEAEKARYEKAGFTTEQAKEIAANNIRNTYPTYSLVPQIVKELRKFPTMGTFVSFPAEVIRTYANTWALAIREMKDPRTRHIGATRMSGLILASIAVKAISQYTKQIWGVTEKEEKALREMQAPWSRNSDYVYVGRDKKNVPIYIDLGYSDPYNYLKKPINAMMINEDPMEGGIDAVKEMAEPFVSTEMLFQRLVDIKTNKKEMGGEVYNPQLPLGDKLKNSYEYLMDVVEPGTITSLRRIYKGYKGESSESGKQYDFENELIAIMLGQRVNSTNVESAFGYKTFNFDRELQDAKRIYNRSISQNKSVQEVEEAYAKSMAAREKLYNEFLKDYQAATTLGIDQDKLDNLMKKYGLDRKMRRAIMANEPYSSLPSYKKD